MANGCVPGSGGRRQDRDEEAVKVYLIRFIANLPLRLVYGLRDWVPFKCELGQPWRQSLHPCLQWGKESMHCLIEQKG